LYYERNKKVLICVVSNFQLSEKQTTITKKQGLNTGWRMKSGTYVLYVDRVIWQFWKRLASIIAVKGGYAEHCSVEAFDMTTMRLFAITRSLNWQSACISVISHQKNSMFS